MPVLAMTTNDTDQMNSLRNFFKSSLSEFACSPSAFSVLYTHPPVRLPPPSALPIKTLYVLDSSFNPPSRAHLHIAKSALLSPSALKAGWAETRLLLLLATQNADKAPKPAAFEERLAMMVLMARDLLSQVEAARTKLRSKGEGNEACDGQNVAGLMIDIGVTKKPYFIDKATAIDESGVYGQSERVEQVHLTGFDTLTRIFDKKYYGEEGLGALEPFLGRHRIRALVRPDETGSEGERKGEGAWGSREEQEEWLQRIERGEMEGQGLRREWADKIELVDAGKEAEGVSSTKARQAVKEERWRDLEDMLGKNVASWVKEERLYQQSD